MEKKTLDFSWNEIEDNSDYFQIRGKLAAYGNVDYFKDRIMPYAFKSFLGSRKEKDTVPLFWNHKQDTPIGTMPVEKMSEDKDGLSIEAFLPKNDDFVKGRVIPQVKIGAIKGMSIGYDVVDYMYMGDVRELKELHLWEGSLTPLPANDQATIIDYKSVTPFANLPLADQDAVWSRSEAVPRVLDWAGNDLEKTSVQKKFQKAFFWFDSEKPDIQGSYKLPFADVIGGKLQAVPRAVFAAAAAMQGARNYPDIPRNDWPAIIKNIESYYKKMNRESPFGKSFRIDDLDGLEPRILESLLKDGVRFSGNKSKHLVSIFKNISGREALPGSREAILKQLDNKLNKIMGKV